MGEVAVHLHDQLGAVGECVPEAREVGGPEAFLPLPVQHVDPVELGGQPVRDLARAVG